MSDTRDASPHQVVVVEVDDAVGERMRPDRPIVYVDTTAGDPAWRVLQLLAGERGPQEIRGHVVRDRPDLYARFRPATGSGIDVRKGGIVCQLIRSGYHVWGHAHHRVYVIELDPSVKHPGSDRLWVYVGQTSLTPEARFAQHRSRAKNAMGRIDLANTDVHNYGLRLLPKLYDHRHRTCHAEAEDHEHRVAEELLGRGYRLSGAGFSSTVAN